ncbi:hypothetical protein VKT23_000061 [Stygiomarasmius scandens]|uniref:FAD-binding PCMH-type domain-containing protein n=1 Tax=Marasmiellus scandens TaxID=2682957 RepID=A0ABR1K5L6_9AGAR
MTSRFITRLTSALHFLLTSFILSSKFVLAAADSTHSDFAAAKISAIFPGDVGYENASKSCKLFVLYYLKHSEDVLTATCTHVVNFRFTLFPAAIAFPSNLQEVSETVKIGAIHGLNVVPRGGGHSYIANGLGGKNGTLVVDMSKFKDIQLMDPTSLDSEGTDGGDIARIGSGVLLGDVVQILNQNGRAVPHGTCPYVGIAGHAALGGFGFTSRMWGLALDPLVAINAVLADGTIVRATEFSHPDLFWELLRLSLLLPLEFRTFPVPPYAIVFTYVWEFSSLQAASAFLEFQSFVLSKSNGPQAPFGAEILLKKGTNRGSLSFGITGAWYGPPTNIHGVDSINSTLSPFLSKMLEPSQQTRSGNGSYVDSARVLGGHPTLDTADANQSHNTFYAKSIMVPEDEPLEGRACEELMKKLAGEGFESDTDWFIEAELWGGLQSKINAISVHSAAFARRNTLFTIQFYAASLNAMPPYPEDGFKFVDGLVDALIENMPINWNYGAYTDYIDNRLENWRHLYYGPHYPRLQDIKRKVDPKNVFGGFPTSIEV